jgi:uncharacterized MAPEG superfamily protein
MERLDAQSVARRVMTSKRNAFETVAVFKLSSAMAH